MDHNENVINATKALFQALRNEGKSLDKESDEYKIAEMQYHDVAAILTERQTRGKEVEGSYYLAFGAEI